MARPLFLFAHGAGAPSSSPWMIRYAEGLAKLGKVVAFDYPYMQQGRKSPDRLHVLIAAHTEALNVARKGHRGKVVLIGKSMGSRVGCHVAVELAQASQRTVDGVICLGYPLKGMGKTAKLRDEVLLALQTPILFAQGTRDSLCPLDLLQEVRGKMQAPNELYVVETGDHSLKVTQGRLKREALTQDDIDNRVLTRVGEFVANL